MAVVSDDGRAKDARHPLPPTLLYPRRRRTHASPPAPRRPPAAAARSAAGQTNTAAPPTAERRPHARYAGRGAHLAAGRRGRRWGAIPPPHAPRHAR